MEIDTLGPQAEGPALSATQDLPPVKEFAKPAPKLAEEKTEAKPEESGEEAEVEKEEAEVEEAKADEVEAEPAKPEPPKGVRKRIDELTALRITAEKRAVAAERALQQALELANRPKAEAPQPTQAPADPRPVRSQYADPDAYDAALVEWTAKETAKQVQAMQTAAQQRSAQEAAQAANQKAAQAAIDAYEARRQEALKKYEDYEAVAQKPDLPVTNEMAAAIVQESNGPDILYHLGKHPEEAKKISEMSPAQVISAIAKLSVKLEAKPTVSKTPAPVKPVGSRSGATSKSPVEMSMEEYAQHRQQQLRKK